MTVDTIVAALARWAPGGTLRHGVLVRLAEIVSSVETIPDTGLLSACDSLVATMTKLENVLGGMVEPLELASAAGLMTFSCDDCGKCCQSRIGVSLADIKNVLARPDVHFMLPFIIVDRDRGVPRVMNKGEFNETKSRLAPRLLQKIAEINPSLGRVDEIIEGDCVFHDSIGNKCMVHYNRFLECQVYPVANIVLDGGEVACDPSCFDQDRDFVEFEPLERAIDMKRTSDVAWWSAMGLNPRGGVLFQTCKLLSSFREMGRRDALWDARREG